MEVDVDSSRDGAEDNSLTRNHPQHMLVLIGSQSFIWNQKESGVSSMTSQNRIESSGRLVFVHSIVNFLEVSGIVFSIFRKLHRDTDVAIFV